MSPLYSHRLALLFALVQWFANIVCGNVHVTCPRIPGPPESSPANSLSFRSNVHPLSLNTSCFAINIALNVENILPDPSYISRRTNMEVIVNALQNTLRDRNIYGLDIAALHHEPEWSVVNQCPQKTDETVHKFHLETVSYGITCSENSLKVVNEYIECEFQTPASIAYQFTLQSVNALLRMRGDSISIEASIFNTTNDALLAQSNVQIVTNQAANHEFVFSPIVLTQNAVYLLQIRVVTGTDTVFELLGSTAESLVLSTIAAPNACVLGPNLAVGRDMKWGLAAFCNEANAEKRSFFENYIYQKHSSQVIIPHELHVRRRLDATDATEEPFDPFATPPTPVNGGSSSGGHNSLYKLYASGLLIQLADDTVAPSYAQCIAIDPDTGRIFSVGGNVNGAAINRLAVHQIDALDSAQLVGSLSLDRARSGALCHYWQNKRDSEQYIIVINGMNEAEDSNIDHWFNDIVFIALNPENVMTFPPITLAHNVIDMKTYITDSDELYLIGGRDGYNAVNYIQSIHLERVLDAALLNDGRVLHTVDRMEPMLSNVVRPYVDTVRVRNTTCLMVFGGQNVVNNEWIDTQIPSQKLQLICNDNLEMNTPEMHHFTAFDEAHLQRVTSFEDYKETNDIFMTDYSFANDDIWYEFSASFKVCNAESGDAYSDEYLNEILNSFEIDNGVLRENILSESQHTFTEWNRGFSDVMVSDLNFIRTSSSDSGTGAHCVGLSHSVCDGLRIAGNNGDQVCGYNSINGDCYAIQRIPAGYSDHISVDMQNESVLNALVQSDELPLVISLIGAIAMLVVFIVCGACVMYRRNKKIESIHKPVAMAMAMDVKVNSNTNTVCETENDVILA